MSVRQSGATGIGLLLAVLVIAGCTPANVRTGTGPSAVVASIPLTDFGTGIAISPDGTRAYVAAGAKVQVVDIATNKVTTSMELGDMPYSIALSNDGQRGYVVDLMQREVWFIDLVSSSVVKRVELGEPRRPVLRPGVAVSPDGRTVYTTLSQPEGAGPDLLYSIDTTTGAKQQHALGFHPGDLVADKDGRHLWVAGCRGLCSDGALHAVDPSDPGHARQLVLPTVPGEIAISPDGARVYVTNGLAASVAVADTAAGSIVTNVKVGAEPLGVATSPDGKRVYVTNFQSGTMSVIDAQTNEVTDTLNVGATPRAVAVTPDGKRAYLTHSTSRVSVVDLSARD
jgi:YVTN family beta-propeller protein